MSEQYQILGLEGTFLRLEVKSTQNFKPNVPRSISHATKIIEHYTNKDTTQKLWRHECESMKQILLS